MYCIVQKFNIIADDLYNTRTGSTKRQLRRVSKIIVHPQYTHEITPHFDIAVLLVERAFQLTETLQPIQRHSQYDGGDAVANCSLAGWNVGLVDMNNCHLYSRTISNRPIACKNI